MCQIERVGFIASRSPSGMLTIGKNIFKENVLLINIY